ncbi:MmgE/PrpD family protein [Halomonas salipaludis]|uniref:2-methylcitrate dehydratase n=1 Tax=Halomonas salipaludis TaxID=2032625 RepID=A0A2A2ENS3_9GAMM|nr:MmgE/PrpD family protein [Halomonas salipaludis]PAU74766.1 2-methylcitrate dehydratase [Halomonas salipaludis]
MKNPIERLAQVANDWQHRPLTPEVDWATRRALLDWFATTLPGTRHAPATLLSEAFSTTRGTGKAMCYVDGLEGTPRYAALLNATASHTVEFDDIFKDGGYHPGSSTIAAALAIAQDVSASRDRLHRAIIGGYEVGCRIALAIQPSHYTYWHTSATVGTIGAAVSTAMLLGASQPQIGHAIALSSSFAGGHQQNLQGEGMAKPLHAGHAADAGLMAGMAASHGVTASLDSLNAPNGFAAATSDSTGNWDVALDGLGEWTPITRMTIKNHGCCGHIFPALDGLKVLRERENIPLNQIQRIHIEGYGATYSMCNRPAPNSDQEARFSLQYCIAAFVVLGKVRLQAFESAMLSDTRVRDLMKRVTVSERSDIAKEYPAKRMANIIVTTNDGKKHIHFQETRKGDPEDPMSDDELIEKYDELTTGILPRPELEQIKNNILWGNELPGGLG